jgi:hypothetical protein
LAVLLPATAVISSLLAVTASLAPASEASGIVPPRNPSRNLAPLPNFMSSGPCYAGVSSSLTCANPCVSTRPILTYLRYANTPSCTAYVLRAINRARGVEGVSAMALPSNWHSLSPAEQLFVLVDLERVDRGLPPYLGLNARLSAVAEQAARHYTDPQLATGFAVGNDPQRVPGIGGAWAATSSTLEADYIWMYDDGWAGSVAATPNAACTFRGAPGCWSHRDQLLGRDVPFNPGVGLHCATCEVGAGFAPFSHTSSFTVLIELPARRPPGMYFTWASNVQPFLASASTTARGGSAG